MKENLLKLWMAMSALLGLVACGSPEPLSSSEAAKWIAAYTPNRIDMEEPIRIETTERLREQIDTLRSLEGVFKFSPALEGEPRFVQGGRTIEFRPRFGALKQGREYSCRLSLARLTGIDSLGDFAFRFVVERREVKLTDVRVSVDPEASDKAVVEGLIIFSREPDPKAAMSDPLTCSDSEARTFIGPTAEASCLEFRLSNLRRESEERSLKITYAPSAHFSEARVEVTIPGLSTFKLLSAMRHEATQPYIELLFSAPLSEEQELDGLITIDGLEELRIERRGANVRLYYPTNGLEKMTLRLSELIRSAEGRMLSEEIEKHFEQEVIPPAIRVPISGTILPDGKNLKFPFQTVNLAAVDVEVVKIYTDNVMAFLQEHEVEGYARLRRFGRLIFKQTVRLDQDPSLDLHNWQNFSIDLKGLFRQERGAIYNIRLSFRRAYSLYNRATVEPFELIEGPSKQDQALWDKERAYIDRWAPDYDDWTFDWQEMDDPSTESYYMCSERMPEYNLMASNLGLQVKRAEGERLWCTVTDLLTARPLSGVRVAAYNYQMREIGAAYSSSEGFADFKVQGTPFIVTAFDGRSTTYLKINSGHELSLSAFDVGGKRAPDGVKGFVYGERGVWRPGDEIFLSLIVEDREHTLPRNHPVTLELYTPQEQLYETRTLGESCDGIYSFRLRTSENAPTGRWNARFKVGGREFNHPVRIETIKPNRLKIRIKTPPVLRPDSAMRVGLEAHWLTGPAAVGLRASMELTLLNNPSPFERFPGFRFSNPLSGFTQARHTLFSALLDLSGDYEQRYTPPKTELLPGMLQANLVARVAEAGGDESITSKSVPYSPFDSYVGIDLGERYRETDTDLHFPIVTLDAAGRPIDRELHYKIYQMDWSWWWEESPSALSRYVQSSSIEVVGQGRVATRDGHGELAFRVDYPDCGRYLIHVEDPRSGHATGGIVVIDWPSWRGSSGREQPTAASMLSFALDKGEYAVGDYATVYLPPSSGGRALLSVENGSRVISRHWVETSSEHETAHRLPVTEQMAPNFYLHATLLQPHAESRNDLPLRLYGVQGAMVVDPQTILHPEIEAPEEITPHEEFTLRIRERDGKSMSYTLAIVDEGLLDITAYKTPEPWSAIYQREALGVKTWDMYDDVIGAYGGRFGSILSIGGDEALRLAAGKEKRFNPVVKFLGPFTLKRGERVHKITLPMYVGSVRVMVVAAKEGAYGHADKTVAVRSPLMLLPTLPRKANCGDRFRMPVNLFALKDGVGDVKLSVDVEGPLSIVGAATKRERLPRSGEKMLNFELACDPRSEGTAKVVITAHGGNYRTSDTLYLTIENPLPPVVTSRGHLLEAGKAFRLEWPGFSRGEVRLGLASAPSIDFGATFNYVEHYPHSCSEQLSSRAIFMLHARPYLKAEEQQRSEGMLRGLFKELSKRQVASGGFAYWPGHNEAHEWVSSMVGELLIEARRQGYLFPEALFERWIEYQFAAARRYRHTTEGGADLQQAYRLYTLVAAGEQPTALMNKLRESKSLSRQALVRLAAAYSLVGRRDVADHLLEGLDKAPEKRGTYATFWSPLRDRAMELDGYLLMGRREQAFRLAGEIAERFSAAGSSTQELAFVGMAMSRFMAIAGSADGEILLTKADGERERVSGLNGVVQRSLRPEKESVEVENCGEGMIYLTLMTSRQPAADEIIPASQQGVSLRVSYTDLAGQSLRIDSLRQGTEFLAHIEVEKQEGESPSMALTYLVPSGWEIWNERLVASGSVGESAYTDRRDDRISWYFALRSGAPKRFVVRLRAAYLGEYMLPPTLCEEMYESSCRALTPQQTCIVW